MNELGKALDIYLHKYHHILLVGDFNYEVSERSIHDFCNVYNLESLSNTPTCFKNPENLSCIDPKVIYYRDYKYFDSEMFSNELENELRKLGSLTLNYDIFKNVCMDAINKHAPLKGKYIRANQAEYMDKELSEAIMKHSKLRKAD